ncbi:MAG: hypothetical protein ACFFAS_11080 [Promethearchaeota archaeon]
MDNLAKGAMLIQLVKIIKANKTGAYDNLLTEETVEVIKQRILPSSWYPYEVYKNCINAVTVVEGKSNMETVHSWGHVEGQRTFTEVYKIFVAKTEPKIALEKFARFRKLMFTVGDIKLENFTETSADIRYMGFDPEFQSYYYMSRGWAEKFLELCIDQKVSSEFIAKSWEGAKNTIIRLLW